jgi:hypothetical protein
VSYSPSYWDRHHRDCPARDTEADTQWRLWRAMNQFCDAIEREPFPALPTPKAVPVSKLKTPTIIKYYRRMPTWLWNLTSFVLGYGSFWLSAFTGWLCLVAMGCAYSYLQRHHIIHRYSVEAMAVMFGIPALLVVAVTWVWLDGIVESFTTFVEYSDGYSREED